MADTVRAILEEMIPELEDFQKKGYFSRPEIQQIVKKRTDFEYKLKRRAAVKADYLRQECVVISTLNLSRGREATWHGYLT